MEQSAHQDGGSEAKDSKGSYTGAFTEPSPTKVAIKVLKNAPVIFHQELFNVRTFSRHLQGLLRKQGNVVTFNDFEVWQDVVPMLAQKLGLQHVVIEKSHPYFEYTLQGGKFHVLINSNGQYPDSGDVDDSLVEALDDHIFTNHVEHWLRDFRQNIEIRHLLIWKLLMAVCRNSPLAMPRLEILRSSNSPLTGPDNTESGSREHQLVLINENYSILVVKRFELSTDFLEIFLAEAVIDYMEAIHSSFPSEVDYPFRFIPGSWEPAEFLSRGLSILGWGDIRFEEEPLHDFGTALNTLDLWTVKIQTPNHGQLGPSITWSNRKRARLMAILHACGVVKGHIQAAFQSGRFMPEEYQVFARYWSEDVSDVKQASLTTPDTSSPAKYKVTVNEKVISNMLEALRSLVQAGFQSTYGWSSSKSAGLELEHRQPEALTKDSRLDLSLYEGYLRRKTKPTNGTLDLPVRNDVTCSRIKDAVESSAVTIITAATGSGKTTQVPQIILDQYIAAESGSICNIVCTQPRRVATIAVATRVASERGQEAGQDVGYKVRFDSRPTRTACGITYMTSGYLLRLLESDASEMLHRHSHIILDEVHARDVDTDLILTILKNLLGKRALLDIPKMPKIILMSATINAGFFKKYFEELGSDIKVTAIDVPGMMHHVENKNLDNVLVELQETHSNQLNTLLETPEIKQYVSEQTNFTTTIEDESTGENANGDSTGDTRTDEVPVVNKDLFVPLPLLHLIIVRLLSTTTSGDILVFLPGLGEIDALEVLLQNDPLSQPAVSDFERHRIFKLHSALYNTNYDVFKEIPSRCRRIVLATNIAETSITLPNVKFVIDTGLSRQNTFDQVTQSGTFGLQWISKAEVQQRKGRAGRTQTGVYYGVYSEARYNAMSNAPTPEILRTPLDHLVLRSSSSSASRLRPSHIPREANIEGVLAGQALLTAPSPPGVSHVAAAAQQLQNIRALTEEGDTTAMGRVLSQLPMSPAAAKAVLLGMIFRCFNALLIFGAMREDSPLMFDPVAIGGIVQRRRKLANGTDDDKWADSRAFFLYDGLRRRRDKAAADALKEELSIRHDAYCEYAQISKQTFETLLPMIGLSEGEDYFHDEPDMPQPLFPNTAHSLNRNSKNPDLVKALSLSTSGTRIVCWNHKNWRAHHHERVLPHPKSVNHNNSRRAVLVQRLRRENGDLLSYGTMRTIPKDKYPWLHETATISPLIAILFAESVSLLEEESTFIINGWIKYSLTSENRSQNVRRAAKVIWEYRKALDRFVAHAMQMVSLEPQKLKKVRNGELHVNDFNIFLQAKDNPFRKIIVNSVTKILEIDAKDRTERAVIRLTENEGSEPSVAESIVSRDGLEKLLQTIMEARRNNKGRETPRTDDLQDRNQVTNGGVLAKPEGDVKHFPHNFVQ